MSTLTLTPFLARAAEESNRFHGAIISQKYRGMNVQVLEILSKSNVYSLIVTDGQLTIPAQVSLFPSDEIQRIRTSIRPFDILELTEYTFTCGPSSGHKSALQIGLASSCYSKESEAFESIPTSHLHAFNRCKLTSRGWNLFRRWIVAVKQHYENDAIMNMKRSDPSVPLPVVAEVDSITSWDMENARIYTAVQIKRLPTPPPPERSTAADYDFSALLGIPPVPHVAPSAPSHVSPPVLAQGSVYPSLTFTTINDIHRAEMKKETRISKRGAESEIESSKGQKRPNIESSDNVSSAVTVLYTLAGKIDYMRTTSESLRLRSAGQSASSMDDIHRAEMKKETHVSKRGAASEIQSSKGQKRPNIESSDNVSNAVTVLYTLAGKIDYMRTTSESLRLRSAGQSAASMPLTFTTLPTIRDRVKSVKPLTFTTIDPLPPISFTTLDPAPIAFTTAIPPPLTFTTLEPVSAPSRPTVTKAAPLPVYSAKVFARRGEAKENHPPTNPTRAFTQRELDLTMRTALDNVRRREKSTGGEVMKVVEKTIVSFRVAVDPLESVIVPELRSERRASVDSGFNSDGEGHKSSPLRRRVEVGVQTNEPEDHVNCDVEMIADPTSVEGKLVPVSFEESLAGIIDMLVRGQRASMVNRHWGIMSSEEWSVARGYSV